MFLAREPVAEAGIVEHVGPLQRGHQSPELLFIVDGQQQIAAFGAEQVRRDLAADRLIAELFLPVARHGEIRELGRKEREAGFQHRHVDELANAGMRALKQRRGHGERGRHAGQHVADREAGTRGTHFRMPGDRHDA